MSQEKQREPFDLSKLVEMRENDPVAVARSHKVEFGHLPEEEAPFYEPTPEEIENAKKIIARRKKRK